MLVTTIENIPGKEYEIIGYVEGSAAKSKNLNQGMFTGVKAVLEGDNGFHENVMSDARAIAMNRMVINAMQMDADAVVAMRYVSSPVAQIALDITAYGTAVKFK